MYIYTYTYIVCIDHVADMCFVYLYIHKCTCCSPLSVLNVTVCQPLDLVLARNENVKQSKCITIHVRIYTYIYTYKKKRRRRMKKKRQILKTIRKDQTIRKDRLGI